MSLTITIERTSEYEQQPDKYPYTDAELASAKYVVTLSNGDSHLLNTVDDIEGLIHDELFLNGIDDYLAPAPDAGEREASDGG